MKKSIASLLAGLIFGLGLTISGMVNPAKVLAFLDIFGNWDPSLALVMAGALVVTLIGYKLVLKRPVPVFESKFQLPTRKDIDAPLVVGAALFGIGWGIGGLCPGPAISNLAFPSANIAVFMAGMLASVVVMRLLRS